MIDSPRRPAMPTISLVLVALAAGVVPIHAQDGATPESVVAATYESLERPPGEQYDWDRFRALFLPGASLIPNVEQLSGDSRIFTVEEFIDRVDGFTVVGGPEDRGFHEYEVAAHVDRYGDIAQVFSTYAKRYWTETELLAHGINTYQLVLRDGRWWIASIAWDEDYAAGAIPERFMGASPGAERRRPSRVR